jgi:hypothetical protein
MPKRRGQFESVSPSPETDIDEFWIFAQRMIPYRNNIDALRYQSIQDSVDFLNGRRELSLRDGTATISSRASCGTDGLASVAIKIGVADSLTSQFTGLPLFPRLISGSQACTRADFVARPLEDRVTLVQRPDYLNEIRLN